MTDLREVPTDELLSFQDFTPVHHPIDISTTTIPITIETTPSFTQEKLQDDVLETDTSQDTKLFWTLKYYQKYFDVDTSDVLERLLASVTPTRNNVLSNKIKMNPDLYGPFWISLTLIFTIAISGNISNYLQHANAQYHWKYDFHLVSYAATAIILYITLVPLTLWGILRWSSDKADLTELEGDHISSPLELICVYGYSLFIYIPVSILWWIQVGWFQWLLVLTSALLSGLVLVLTLQPSLWISKHRFVLIAGVVGCHFLLAAGFMWYFFHVPISPVISQPVIELIANKTVLMSPTAIPVAVPNAIPVAVPTGKT